MAGSIAKFILLSLFATKGVATALNTPPMKGEIDTIDNTNKIAIGEVNFGLKLFEEIQKVDSSSNVFLSPLSISMVLSLTMNGATGETKDSMKRALGLDKYNDDEINSSYLNLRESLLRPDSEVTIEIANALWGKLPIKFKHDFIMKDAKYYKAELKLTKFNEAAVRMINKWVKVRTHHKITKIVEKIDPNTILFITNAIYFKGKWTHTFDKEKTKEGDFELLNGSKIKVPMMHQKGTFSYLEYPNFQVVSLPYGKEKKISMYIFLPREGFDLRQLSRILSKEYLQIIGKLRRSQGVVAIPKFKVKYDRELKEILRSLGMGIAFDPNRASFDEIAYTDYNIYLQGVKHKAYVEVNEEGTEAAALTSVEVGITALPKRFKMVVSRPFIFTISDRESRLILFIGQVTNPTL